MEDATIVGAGSAWSAAGRLEVPDISFKIELPQVEGTFMSAFIGARKPG